MESQNQGLVKYKEDGWAIEEFGLSPVSPAAHGGDPIQNSVVTGAVTCAALAATYMIGGVALGGIPLLLVTLGGLVAIGNDYAYAAQRNRRELEKEKLNVSAGVVGSNTRLNAVPVQSVEVEEDVNPQPEESPAFVMPDLPSERIKELQPDTAKELPSESSRTNHQQVDIVDQILEQGNSLAFFGAQRCGKSRLMAIASQQGVIRGKFKFVTVLSGLAKEDEDPEYWHHAKYKGFYDLAPLQEYQKERVFADWLQKINDFRASANTANPGLLIVDEYVYAASQSMAAGKESVAQAMAQAIVDVVSVVESGGAKRGWHLWIGCPSCTVTGLGPMGQAMKKLSLVFCAISKGEQVDTKGVMVGWNPELFQQVCVNYKSLREPAGHELALSGRIVFFNGQWCEQTSLSLSTPTHQTVSCPPSEDKRTVVVRAIVQYLARKPDGVTVREILAGKVSGLDGLNAQQLGEYLTSMAKQEIPFFGGQRVVAVRSLAGSRYALTKEATSLMLNRLFVE